MSRRYIPEFSKWTRLFEGVQEFENTKSEIRSISAPLLDAKSQNALNTRVVLDWMDDMLKLYDTTTYTYFVFDEMKKVINANINTFKPFFTKDNRELTRQDINNIIRFKEIGAEEADFNNRSSEILKKFLLID